MGSTQMIGQRHYGNTIDWKDIDFLSSPDHKISKIKVFYDSIIVGIQVYYTVGPYNMTEIGPWHLGKNYKDELNAIEFLLDYNEYLVEIYGRSGAAIDQIGFKTDKRDLGNVGAQTGSPFSFKADNNYYFSTFSGGVGGYLDYLQMTQSKFPNDLEKFHTFTEPSEEYLAEYIRKAKLDSHLEKERQDQLEGPLDDEDRILISFHAVITEIKGILPEAFDDEKLEELVNEITKSRNGLLTKKQLHDFFDSITKGLPNPE